ncbi:hypothetical protein BBBOND_0102210 [Babesia bigemina]|uniref:6-Cys domain-containing protein n=1 Tax=Babesia bigemina TaxID=5866 RepID=A0A061D1A9_BABBI|nr:hypothetical protein BBBOND_0102210 [Babesia bigemina]CDR93892.1 hypothetical protein BBBOND_0102210 [Babesia bigemina]|eukprot:XP_012766078.1 hypothetical protein BBBOND_0102210 [Babesia bigemina]
MMVKRRMRGLWIFGSIVAHWTLCFGTFLCDFDYPEDLLSNNAFAVCNMDIGYTGSATLICPRQVNGTEYVWHPQPTSGDTAHLSAYVSGNGKLRVVALSNVVVTDEPVSIVSVRLNPYQTRLIFSLREDQIYAITEHHSIFICGPRDLVFSDTLQLHLDRMNSVAQMQALPWTAETPLINEIKQLGKSIGAVFMYRGHVHMPIHGCGSRPSPLFAADVVTVDPVTGARSCVVDPMSKTRIGFVCEGRVEPDDCLKSLLDTNGDVVSAPLPDYYWNIENFRPWVIAQYINDLALPEFTGECRCIDPETKQMKARIEIRSNTEYVCDIANMIFRNRVRPIIGPWCSVVLHPGSTLTIRFPSYGIASNSSDIQPEISGDKDYETDTDESVPTVALSQLPSIYEYEFEFLPKEMITLRQLKSAHYTDLYDEVSYEEALAGDALELDVSQMAQGEVKLKYRMDKPLALRSGKNLFVYHWTLGSKNTYVLERIRAAVNVSFAFTHRYNIIGCDRSTQSVFNQDISEEFCSASVMKHAAGDIYECVYDGMRDGRQTGIHCETDEELLPGNCDSTGYDLYSNQIVPFPASIGKATPFPIPGFQVFDFESHNISALSFVCSCVNQLGYETSRLVMERNHHETYRYTVRREEPHHTLAPYLLLPWHEVAVSSDELKLSRPIVIFNTSSKSIELNVGTTLWLGCVRDAEVIVFDEMENVEDASDIRTTWLPKHPEMFYYTLNDTAYGRELIRMKYNNTFVTTPRSLEVTYQEVNAAGGYQIIIIDLNKRAIFISKDPMNKKFVPMTFVCGKALQISDLSIVTTNAAASEAASPNDLQTIGSSARYTWNVVEISVKTTDPYMHGCGVTYESIELFKPETPELYDDSGRQIGCKIDIQAAGEAAFYCPAPYVLDPPNCFEKVLMGGIIMNVKDISKSLIASASNHFVILRFDSELIGSGETLRQKPPLECQCVTTKGIVLSTIQIKNYYA